MEYDDKTLALAKYLECDPALIENDYGDYFTVNSRKIKDGRTPDDYKKLAADFRALLNEEMAELITEAIINPLKEVEVETNIKDGDTTKLEKKKRLASDVAYDKVSEYLEPMKEKAKIREEQLARLNAGSFKPPIKETPEDIYTRLQQDNLYVVNVLYYLVKADIKDYCTDHYTSLRRAWLGQPVSDTRKDREVDDGEYLVFEDDEADEYEREGLEQLFDDIVEIPDHLMGYVDKEKWIDDQAGNRGENIGGYDSEENEVEFEGTTYYIYRHN